MGYMIIDGEELHLKCVQCGTKYKHVIGYGPCAPSYWLRREQLRKHPPCCPKCGSTDYKRQSILEIISDLFK